MASPINTFKSYAVAVTTTPNTFYTTPVDATTIVLLAQATNVGSGTATITLTSSINGGTEIVKNYAIPVGDAAGLLTGKLVVEAGQSLTVSASADSTIKLTISILETR